jgi:hypothetical protein
VLVAGREVRGARLDPGHACSLAPG